MSDLSLLFDLLSDCRLQNKTSIFFQLGYKSKNSCNRLHSQAPRGFSFSQTNNQKL